MKDAFYNLPKAIAKFSNTLLPAIEFIEESYEDVSDNLQEGVKFIIPSNIFDIYIRLETLLGFSLSGNTDTLTESSNLMDE